MNSSNSTRRPRRHRRRPLSAGTPLPLAQPVHRTLVGAPLELNPEEDLRPLGEGGAVPPILGGHGGGQEEVRHGQAGRHSL